MGEAMAEVFCVSSSSCDTVELFLFHTLPLSLTSSLLRLLLRLIIIVYKCCCLFPSHSLSHSLTLTLSSVYFFFLLLFPLTLSSLVLILLSLSFSLQATEEGGEGATEEAAAGIEQIGMALVEVHISRARSLSLLSVSLYCYAP